MLGNEWITEICLKGKRGLNTELTEGKKIIYVHRVGWWKNYLLLKNSNGLSDSYSNVEC